MWDDDVPRKDASLPALCKHCISKGNPAPKVVNWIITVANPDQKPRSEHFKYGIDNEDSGPEMFVN